MITTNFIVYLVSFLNYDLGITFPSKIKHPFLKLRSQIDKQTMSIFLV